VGDLSEHFSRAEFACKCGCGKDDVTLELVIQLERLRSFIRRPIIVTSGVRCAIYNAKVGGKPDGAHLTGEGADIACLNSHTRWQMLRIIFNWSLFDRVGVGETFLHVDISRTLPQEVAWIYPSS
jgi:uncharacterized protein YcbK (DUF882 family)